MTSCRSRRASPPPPRCPCRFCCRLYWIVWTTRPVTQDFRHGHGHHAAQKQQQQQRQQFDSTQSRFLHYSFLV